MLPAISSSSGSASITGVIGASSDVSGGEGGENDPKEEGEMLGVARTVPGGVSLSVDPIVNSLVNDSNLPS